ncbi:MAG: DUF115 domain-containing protein [Clostridium sp.]|nr:DUF115 domain-containing protein [Clostridium sp.]
MVKFVVWGAGDRGHIAAEIFGSDRIVAFIDSDPQKAGKTFYDRPVIDFAYYKTHYSDYAILVSLAMGQSIVEILDKEDIFFFEYNECPPELIGYGWKRARKYLDSLKTEETKAAVYGHTLYSVLMYEYLHHSGHECAGLIFSRALSEKRMESFGRMFPFITVKKLDEIDADTTILKTIREDECDSRIHGWKTKDIYDWKRFIPDYKNPGIAEMKDRYKGKRCFIVATGPSLTFDDLEKLKQHREFCISVNTIFKGFDKTGWRPDQYVVVDVNAMNHFGSEIRKMEVKEKFIADASIDFDYDSLTEEFYVYHSIFTKSTWERGLISDDFSEFAYNSGLVTTVSLQLAIYEGFDEIYLLGCDCSYAKTGFRHFNEPKEEETKVYGGIYDLKRYVTASEVAVNSYQKIKEYAEQRGIKIYNATRGGYLEVFERVNLDELLRD